GRMRSSASDTLTPALSPARALLARIPLGLHPWLLWQSLISRDRASSATAPRLPDADRRRLPNGRSRDLPVPVQGASAHARFFDHAGSFGPCDGASETCCLPRSKQRRHPGLSFRGSMAGLCPPLPTLRRRPRGRQRTARGRCGSLLLHRSGLAPPTPCRSPGALRVLHGRSPPANTREGSERGADGLVSCRDRSLGGAISFGRDLCGRSIVHAVIIDRR